MADEKRDPLPTRVIPEHLPLYLLVEDRPVSIEEVDGHVRVMAWDFERGEMVPDRALISLLEDYGSRADDVREIDRAEFDARVAALERGAKKA